MGRAAALAGFSIAIGAAFAEAFRNSHGLALPGRQFPRTSWGQRKPRRSPRGAARFGEGGIWRGVRGADARRQGTAGSVSCNLAGRGGRPESVRSGNVHGVAWRCIREQGVWSYYNRHCTPVNKNCTGSPRCQTMTMSGGCAGGMGNELPYRTGTHQVRKKKFVSGVSFLRFWWKRTRPAPVNR